MEPLILLGELEGKDKKQDLSAGHQSGSIPLFWSHLSGAWVDTLRKTRIRLCQTTLRLLILPR